MRLKPAERAFPHNIGRLGNLYKINRSKIENFVQEVLRNSSVYDGYF